MRTETIQLMPGREDVTLTAYLLDDSPEMVPGGLRGAVIVCPGGGYLNLSDREAEPIALRFAGMGYHAFVLRYSVYDRGVRGAFPTAQEPSRPETIFPHAVEDLARAVLTVKRRAEEWRVDPDLVAAIGFSAGAHNVAQFCVSWDKPALQALRQPGDPSLQIATGLLSYPITDYVALRAWMDREHPPVEEFFYISNQAFLGLTWEEQTEEVLRSVSPARLVTAACPPLFLWHTCADGLVPVDQSTRMATALAEAGVPFELHVFEHGGHGLALANEATAGEQAQIEPEAEKWIDLADRWLRRRFWPNLPQA